MVSRGTLSAGHARAILILEDEAEQIELARRIVSRGLSVREAERLAAAGASASRKSTAGRGASAQIRHLEKTLQEALGTKVEIKQRGKRGKIIIHFHTADEFDRLFEIMTGMKM